MNKNILALLIGIFLIVIVVAPPLITIFEDKTIPRDNFTTEERLKLESLGIDEFDYTDRIDEEKAYRKLISRNEFNLPEISVKTTYQNCIDYRAEIEACLEYETLNFTEDEIDDLLDAKMIEVEKDIANAEIKRDTISSDTTREGSVSISR